MSEQIARESQGYRTRKRAWYFWPVLLLWLALIGFLVQNAIGSSAELEPRAAMIFWVSAGVVFLAGIVISVTRGRE